VAVLHARAPRALVQGSAKFVPVDGGRISCGRPGQGRFRAKRTPDPS